MMTFNRVWASLVATMLLIPLFGQDVAESNYSYMKKETAPGFSVIILGQPDNVEDVVEEMIEAQTKSKGKSKKGMLYFEKAQLSPISSEKVSYYFTMEHPSRKDKNHTRVHMFMRNKSGQFLTSVTAPQTAQNAKDWLTDLEVSVKIHEMKLVLEDQAKVLEKAMRQQNSLVSDSVQLQRDLVDLQETIAENANEIQAQKAEVAKEVGRLDDFRAKLEALKEERRAIQESRMIQDRNRR
jgi:hypothetical protein